MRAPISATVPFSMVDSVAQLMPSDSASSAWVRPLDLRAARRAAPISSNILASYYIRCIRGRKQPDIYECISRILDAPAGAAHSCQDNGE